MTTGANAYHVDFFIRMLKTNACSFSIFSFQKKKNNNGFSYSPHISV